MKKTKITQWVKAAIKRLHCNPCSKHRFLHFYCVL